MGMDIRHRIHGDDLHDLVIFLVEREVVRRGHKLLDGRWFRDRFIYSGEPDAYYRKDERISNGAKKVNHSEFYVVEVESKATSESIARKRKQFGNNEHLAGHDMIVIDLKKLTPEERASWPILQRYVAERVM